MSNGHICCLWGVCCPPEMMAAQIAGHWGIPIETAQKMAEEIGVMIPRNLPSTTQADLLDRDMADFMARLAKLHRHVKRELIGILSTLGLPTE